MPDGEKKPTTVERIFQLFAERWSIAQIVRILNKEMPEWSVMPRWNTDVVARSLQLGPQAAKCSQPSELHEEQSHGQEFDERG